MDKQWDDPSMILHIADESRQRMQQQGVQESYVRQVIAFAESTSTKLVNTSTNRLIAHLRIGNITCWVEYAPEGDGYRVYRAYTHRMDIEGDDGWQHQTTTT